MKIKSKSNKKKIVIISLVALLLVVGAGIWFVVAKNNQRQAASSVTSSDGINYSPPTTDELKDSQDAKTNSAENSSTKNSSSNEATGDALPTGQTSVTITAASQNNPLFQVRTLIEKITSDGACNLSLTKGSQTVTKTAKVQAQASASTCQGFDVPISELSPGTWTLTVTYKGTDLQGSATKQVIIQ